MKQASLSWLLVAVAFSMPALAKDVAEDAREYVVLMAGKPVGSRTVTRLGPHEWRYHFEFSDRGRGPDLVAALRTDANGIPLDVKVTGVSYFKNAVDETFSVNDGAASWRNENESGSAKAGSFYIALNNADGAASLLRALLNNASRTLPLLPSGEATVEAVESHVVERDGEKLKLTLHAINGLGFSPQYVWASEDNDVFHDGWVIRKGWESVAEELDGISGKIQARHFAELAKRLVRADGDLLIVNARLFDPAEGSVTNKAGVLVRNGRIVATGKNINRSAIPKDVHRLDARGRFLMPGLYDMHVHNFGDDSSGLQHLAGGVTTVRDLAAPLEHLLAVRERWHAGETLGPRIHMAGFIDGPGKYAGPSKMLVDTREDALAAVNTYADNDFTQVKLYNSISHELVPVIIKAAHERGMKVSGHIPVHMFAEEAVELGYDEIQHINHLFLNFLDREIDNRTPARFTEVATHGAGLDLRSDSVREFIALLKRHDTIVDPTLAIFETSWVSRPGDILPPRAPVADRLPPMVRRQSLWSGLPVPEELDARYKASFRHAQAFVKALHDAGVRIVAGADFMSGFAMHREMELYSDAGISNADVLRIATLGAAEIMNEADRHGRVASGYAADFILVDGDPLKNMSDIRNVTHVVRDGRLYEVAALQAALGMSPAGRRQ
jgi:imidazolonepropionase-like amidohydrolase